jgi:hypothetical protein
VVPGEGRGKFVASVACGKTAAPLNLCPPEDEALRRQRALNRRRDSSKRPPDQGHQD